ncbi:MAG TPA: cytochrome d ubiquinol oxidase subunit II [Desulfomonilaceae bacterium]|nr:cytochrome d ubiquinol oxidase subunit II [Desulfomonilaceae bacterium]
MLETVWFVIWGILWAIYFSLDGYDLGMAVLRPFLSREDTDTRIINNAMGPFWDGNEVWLVTAGGVTFAAFPVTYAVMFSTLYAPLLLILFGLIIRAVSFEFRNKIDSAAWRTLWDTCQFMGSLIPSVLFGVAFANIFQGIPFDDKGVFQGTLLGLFNPYGILGGVLFLFLFCLDGAMWLAAKTEGPLHERTAAVASGLWVVVLVVAVVFLAASWFATPLYGNYLKNPLLFGIPLMTVIALLLTRLFMVRKSWWMAWGASAITVFGATMFGVVGLYPNLFPSSMNAAYSLNAFNSSSTPMTLKIMLAVVLIFIPLVILYQGWVYVLFREKISKESLLSDEAY